MITDVIKTTSNLVMVPVSVTDQQGQAVQGLKVADFRLEEEGKQQEIIEHWRSGASATGDRVVV